ncbi:hypothetical protein NE237_015472 [Protea cynaroides]|uniref:Pectinesterase n=1 Tax=Protea cynaroides TaxID=273540 RepID=A0A9Q0KE04_9MAGN|nr:hypothetical protein NE237_015472 [Protea cynaroides]
MTRKPLIVSVSLILVISVVIGAILVSRNGNSTGEKSLSKKMKSVEDVCQPTLFKDTCMSTMTPIAANESASPKDFLRAALVATIEEVKIMTEKPGAMKNGSHGTIDNMALDDCKEFLQFSIKDLEEALAKLEDNEIHEVNDQVDEFRNWLAAVIAFQETCHDQIRNPELKVGLQDILRNATQLTTNALALFAELSTILGSLNIPLDVTRKPARRLLEVSEHDYPLWLSEGNRRLLVGQPPKPNAVVAQDGSGQFKTIAAALASYPKNLSGDIEFVIYVKAGIYTESKLIVSDKQENVLMYGDGPENTIITGNKDQRKYAMTDTATFTVQGNGFVAKEIGFRNTAGPAGEQALALIVYGDRTAFFHCNIEGFQDSLCAMTHRQFYRDCTISGTIDFVFGQSATIIQNSKIVVRKPLSNQQNIISADGTSVPSDWSHTGLVFQHCNIVAENELLATETPIQTFLGRPWKEYSTTFFMQSTIGDFIDPQGWVIWDTKTPNNQNCYYAEYANTGPGAKTDKRVKWECHKVITDAKVASKFTVAPFYQGDVWLKQSGIPFSLGLNP